MNITFISNKNIYLKQDSYDSVYKQRIIAISYSHKLKSVTQQQKMNHDQQHVFRKHQFQIRKVPLRRFIPEKTPQLYAMDAHSICLPSKIKKKQHWGSLYSEANYCNYEEDFNQQIVNSLAYNELYSKYLKLKDERLKQKLELQDSIRMMDTTIQQQRTKQRKLTSARDQLYTQIETLRNQLTQSKQKNYNLRWQLYNQRGARYANLYGYSFLQPNQLTYQQLLQMQQQIGSVSKGLSLSQIQKLDKHVYECNAQCERQICCICYDQIQEKQWVTVLRCSHTHHCDCIKDWLVKQKICPICKKQVLLTEEEILKSQKNQEVFMDNLSILNNPQSCDNQQS